MTLLELDVPKNIMMKEGRMKIRSEDDARMLISQIEQSLNVPEDERLVPLPELLRYAQSELNDRINPSTILTILNDTRSEDFPGKVRRGRNWFIPLGEFKLWQSTRTKHKDATIGNT